MYLQPCAFIGLGGDTAGGTPELCREVNDLTTTTQGYATDAWDFLSSQVFSTAAGEAQRLTLMAGIRMDSWAEVRSHLSICQVTANFTVSLFCLQTLYVGHRFYFLESPLANV